MGEFGTPVYTGDPNKPVHPNDPEYFAGPNWPQGASIHSVPTREAMDAEFPGIPVVLTYNHIEVIEHALQSLFMGRLEHMGDIVVALWGDEVAASTVKTLRYLIDATQINALGDHDNDLPEMTSRLFEDRADPMHPATR